MNAAESYASKVLSGEIIAGKWVKLACKRFTNDLKRDDIYLDIEECERVVNFFEQCLVHVKGAWAGKPFLLAECQIFFLYNLYGWRYTENDNKRINSCYFQISRKNGKSEFSSGIALYDLLLGGEKESEIVIGSNNEDQAKICSTMAGDMIEQSPVLGKYVGNKIMIYRYMNSVNKIVYKDNGRQAIIFPFNKKAITKEGYNPETGIIDEYHGAQTDDIKSVIQRGQGARRNPKIVVITTAGSSKECPCYRDERAMSVKVLEGEVENDNHFSLIYELDNEKEWEFEENWSKTNPLMYHPEYNPAINTSEILYNNLKREVKEAQIKGGSTKYEVRVKTFGIWGDGSADTWIESDIWNKNNHGITEEELKGVECFGGVDLARSKDLNAYALVFPNVRENVHAVKVWFWIPRPKLEVAYGGVDYRKWVEDDYIRVIDADAIDPAVIGQEIVEISRDYNVQSIAFDPYMAQMGASQAVTAAGYEATAYAQGVKFMGPATKEFEYLAHLGQLEHFDNPVLSWNLANVVLVEDKNENITPHKGKSTGRIDGVVAAIISIGEWMRLRSEEKVESKIEIW